MGNTVDYELWVKFCKLLTSSEKEEKKPAVAAGKIGVVNDSKG
jgi:hypothetical protein